MEDEVLTIEEIAALYKTTRSKAQRYIVKRPGFPPIAPGSTWRDPRWVHSEVIRYIRRQPSQADEPRDA